MLEKPHPSPLDEERPRMLSHLEAGATSPAVESVRTTNLSVSSGSSLEHLRQGKVHQRRLRVILVVAFVVSAAFVLGWRLIR